MMYDLQPDRSITGGSWYSDNEFESEFVEVLNQQCYRILAQKAEAAKLKAVRNCIVNFAFIKQHTYIFF